VKTANGEEGWCFGLYLRETRLEPTPEELAVKVKNKTEETENTYNSAITESVKEKPEKTISGFKIIMVVGFAVLLGGGAAVFVILLEKKAG